MKLQLSGCNTFPSTFDVSGDTRSMLKIPGYRSSPLSGTSPSRLFSRLPAAFFWIMAKPPQGERSKWLGGVSLGKGAYDRG